MNAVFWIRILLLLHAILNSVEERLVEQADEKDKAELRDAIGTVRSAKTRSEKVEAAKRIQEFYRKT